MEESIKLNRKEKRHSLLYLILLFVTASTLLIWIMFRNSDVFASNHSSVDDAYFIQNKEFVAKQNQAVSLYDTMFTRITALKNIPSSASAESDIMYGINTLNSYNENLPTKDPRFINFHQMALFLKLYYEDMMVYKKMTDNVQRFQQQLDECEIGYKDQQGYLNQIKAAQAAKQQQ
jgi:hypothetical protein